MAEEKEQKQKKFGFGKKPEDKGRKPLEKKELQFESLIRILGTDIPGNATLYSGLTKIKGISWTISNAICHMLKMDKNKKVSTLSEQEFEKISSFIKNPQLPEWLLNRKKDYVTGASKHLVTTDLDMQREFDVRKMKKIKSYKGWRHAINQPVRGQRTRSHFRSRGGAVGVMKSKQAPAKSDKAKPAAKGGKK